MDPNAMQQLLGLLQQMSTLVQGMASGDAAAAAPVDDPMAADPPPAGDPTGGNPMGEDDPLATAPADASSMIDPAMTGGDPMAMDGDGGSDNLHDRVSELEEHTGLQKSADSTLLARVKALEETLLGVEYEGSTIERVNQLAKTVGLSVPQAPKFSNKTQGSGNDESPEEIPLDSLIKTAIQRGIQEGISQVTSQLQKSGQTTLPDPTDLRKAAIEVGTARRTQTDIQSDAALVKSAAAFGWSEQDLDQEMTLGDVLQLQYGANQRGESLFSEEDPEETVS